MKKKEFEFYKPFNDENSFTQVLECNFKRAELMCV